MLNKRFIINTVIKNKYLLLLIFIAIVSHLNCFNLGVVLFSWDFPYWSKDAVREMWPVGVGSYLNQFNFGTPNIIIFFNSFFIIWGLIGDYVLASKLTLMIPVALLSFLSPYFLVRYLVKNEGVAFVSALFFGFSSSLMYLELSHLPIAFAFSLAPLILLRFIKLLEKFSYKNLLIFALVYSIGVWYEVRIMYLVTWVLLTYWIIFKGWKTFWVNRIKYLVLSCLLILLNSFWLLPSLIGSSDNISQTARRGITDSSANNIFYSFANFKHKWTGGLVTQDNIENPIPFLFWIAPIFALSIFILFKKIESRRDKKLILFFGFVTLFGIIFAKQSDPPFVELYNWMYENFPGFNLFRVGSKFLSIATLGYLGLFAFSLKYWLAEISNSAKLNSKTKFKFTTGILLLFVAIFLWQGKPFFTKEAGNLLVAKEEPNEYKVLNNFIKEQDGFFRTIWIPKTSQWAYFSSSKPKISSEALEQVELKTFWEYSTRNSKLKNSKKSEVSIFELLNSSLGNEMIDIASIKYFIIPMPDTQDELLYKDERDYLKFISTIGKIDSLEEIKLRGVSQIKIYENSDYKKHFSSNNAGSINFEIINNTKKKVKIKTKQKNFNLIMGERYNDKWRAFPDNSNLGLLKKISLISSKEDYGIEHDHFIGFMNVWKIDVNKFCKKQHCEKNSEGEYEISLLVEYWPQKWYYFGVIISVISSMGCLAWILTLKLKRK